MNKTERKESLERTTKHAFYSGMTYGYGIDHENIHEEEERDWQKFKKTVQELNS